MPERFEGILRPVLRGLFHPASRYPADPRAIFLLALSVFVGLTALTLNYAPDSLNAVLPHWCVYFWGATLTLGSGLALLGITRQDLFGVTLEQVGSVIVGATTLFYSGVSVLVVGWDALQPVGIVFAWGLSCFVRWIQLQLLVHDAYAIKVRREALGDADGPGE